MNLGIHYHIPAVEQAGNIFTLGVQGVFIDALAPHFDSILCFLHTPLENEKSLMNYKVKARNVVFISLGPHKNLPYRLLNLKYYSRIFLSKSSEIDFLLLRTPTVFSNFLISKFKNRVGIYVVGDYIEGLSTIRGNFIKKILINIWGHFFEKYQNFQAKNILVVSNSEIKRQKLLEYNSNAILLKSTTLQRDDFFIRPDTCQNEIVKILFTGRVDESKGLEDILDAIVQISIQKRKFEFHIAGFLFKDRKSLISKLQIINTLNTNCKVIWHGTLSLGKELNELYRSCDIFCLASRSGFEGFPRSIWEALANSMPVIATKVGSIPYFLVDNESALLTEPNNIKELTLRFEKVISDQGLRKKLIVEGRKLAEENTLDKFGLRFSELIKAYVNSSVQ